jgi:hypothetical protein
MFRNKRFIFRKEISFVNENDLPKMAQKSRNIKAENQKIKVSYLRLNVQLAGLNNVQSIYCTGYGKRLKNK